MGKGREGMERKGKVRMNEGTKGTCDGKFHVIECSLAWGPRPGYVRRSDIAINFEYFNKFLQT